MKVLPCRLELVCSLTQTVAESMENNSEACSKSSVEVVAGPRHRVVAVVDIGVIVVPRPPQQLDAHNVIGNVEDNNTQSHCQTIKEYV